jgi:uncharacterized membrane protein
MSRRSVRAGGLVAAALGAVLLGPASPAVARQPAPESDTGPAKCTVQFETVVCAVEVPVSTPIVIHDRATEMLHLGIAAGLGAALAAGATAARLRRRLLPTSGPVGGLLVGADQLIDITDVVQSRTAP